MAPSRAISSDADSVDALIVRRISGLAQNASRKGSSAVQSSAQPGEPFNFRARLRQRPDKTLLQRDARQRMFLAALRIGGEKIVDARLPLRGAGGIRPLRQAARKYVAAEARASDQRLGRGANRLKAAQPELQRAGEFLRGRLLALFRPGQQQPRLQIGEPGGHHEIIGGKLKPKAARGFDEFEILLGEGEDGDFLQIDLLPPGEVEKQVERPLEPVDIDDEGAAAPIFVGLQLKFQFQKGRSRGLIRSSHRA